MADGIFRDRERIARTPAHDVALECLTAGIEAALPAAVVGDAVSVRDGMLRIEGVDGSIGEYALGAYDEVRLLGAGKAADGMADALAGRLGDRLDGGVVVTDATAKGPTATDSASDRPFEAFPGDHPLPSERGVEHTRRAVEVAEAAGADDLVVVAVTGGASALFAAPVAPIGVADLRAVTDALLASGASIAEINAVRKHCSAVKGGRLARVAAPATVVTLAVSDVVGDDRSVIGSGPTVPDPSTYDDALATVERYDLSVPATVREHLRAGAAGERSETPSAGDAAFERVRTFVVANGRTALDAAAATAAAAGYEPLVLAAGVRGEAREAALTHVAVAEECAETGTPATPPAVVLTGGETTVTLGGDDPGSGGPNGEFVAAAGAALDRDGIVVASVDTDGIDGATDAAGGIVDATTVSSNNARD
ncbi:MAG: glycerate 2-kinase, partial [uncultured archaeon A07HR67]